MSILVSRLTSNIHLTAPPWNAPAQLSLQGLSGGRGQFWFPRESPIPNCCFPGRFLGHFSFHRLPRYKNLARSTVRLAGWRHDPGLSVPFLGTPWGLWAVGDSFRWPCIYNVIAPVAQASACALSRRRAGFMPPLFLFEQSFALRQPTPHTPLASHCQRVELPECRTTETVFLPLGRFSLAR